MKKPPKAKPIKGFYYVVGFVNTTLIKRGRRNPVQFSTQTFLEPHFPTMAAARAYIKADPVISVGYYPPEKGPRIFRVETSIVQVSR